MLNNAPWSGMGSQFRTNRLRPGAWPAGSSSDAQDSATAHLSKRREHHVPSAHLDDAVDVLTDTYPRPPHQRRGRQTLITPVEPPKASSMPGGEQTVRI